MPAATHRKRVPVPRVKDVWVWVIVAIAIGGVASLVSGDFGWTSVIASVVTFAFMIGYVALLSWLAASWVRSRGHEPVPLGSEESPGAESLPTPLRSVRLLAAANLLVFSASFGIVGLLLEEIWVAAFGAVFGVWAAIVLLASWALRKDDFRRKGFRW
jgi:hypothetical protein